MPAEGGGNPARMDPSDPRRTTDDCRLDTLPEGGLSVVQIELQGGPGGAPGTVHPGGVKAPRGQV